MPKPNHVHTNDAIVTDQKFRPEDDRVYAAEKREFQGSETRKEEEAESISEQGSTEDTPAPEGGSREE